MSNPSQIVGALSRDHHRHSALTRGASAETRSLRLRSRLIACSALVLSTALQACADPVGTEDRDPPVRQSRSSEERATPVTGNLNDEFVGIAKRVGGFGGAFYKDGALIVNLVDTSRSAEARLAVLTSVRRGNPHGTRTTDVVVRRASYDYRELAQWHRAVGRLRAAGVTVTDIDEERNRVVVGARDAATAAQIRSVLSASGIPSGAVEVAIIEPMVISATLQQSYSPRYGGAQIMNANGGICTLGFNADKRVAGTIQPNVRYFVTNSHCTRVVGQMNSDKIGQPNMSNLIGVEVSDPAFWTGTADPTCPPGYTCDVACPAGRVCRYSDAALVRYNAGVTAWLGWFHRVSGLTITGSDWYHTNSFFTWVGNEAKKVGRTSGYTEGVVTRACADYPQYDYDAYGNLYDTGRTMLCQNESTVLGSGGDSGSGLVEQIPGTADTDAYSHSIAGVLWGVSPTRSVYSAFYYVNRELVDYFNVRGTGGESLVTQ